jgi:hypothetical protein
MKCTIKFNETTKIANVTLKCYMFHFKILFQSSHLNFPESGHMCRLVLHSIKGLCMWVLQNWPSGLIQSTIRVVWSFVCLYVCIFAPLQNSNFWRSKKDLVDGHSTNLGECIDQTIIEIFFISEIFKNTTIASNWSNTHLKA